MEKGVINGSSDTDKAKSAVDDGGTTTAASSYGLQLQNTESFRSKIMMGHRRFQDDGGGPTSNHTGPNVMLCSNEHNEYANATGDAAVVRTLQPFDISANSPRSMAAALGIPFTWAQWKELERQAMIYKYFVAAVPVPPDLLLASHGASHYTLGTGSVQGQRYTKIRDLQPGRCKRTDGKKWRCSRDVAPHQKYCERHMHRGRPRSRKHVEVHAPLSNNNVNDNKKTRVHPASLDSTPMAVPKPPPAAQTNSPSNQRLGSTFEQMENPLFFHHKMGQNVLHRNSAWMMEGELVALAGAGQGWQHMMDSNIGFPAEAKSNPSGASDLQHSYREEELNLLACRDMETAEDVRIKHDGESNFLINPELVSLEQSLKDAPRDFINAWSDDNFYNNSNNDNVKSQLLLSEGNISPSSLNLSMAMAAGNALDEGMGLESGTRSSYHHKSWEKYWVPFASGGPLAEVLHPSSVHVGGENPASSYTSNGDSISPAATAVSSPSGVLQRTLFSHSDGSVCNSPILARPTDMVPFQWLS